MRAIVIREHGGPEVLRLEELPDPEPGPGQVRVRVAAVALNHLDLWGRRGLPHLKLRFPFILGSDIAGTVDRVGAGVEGVTPGEEVVLNPGVSCGRCRECLSGRDNLCRSYHILGETRDGGYAEYVVVPAANLLPAPRGIGWAERAAIPLVFLTAWQMLTRKAAVQPGEVVLIHAVGSGVGSAALQIAKMHGAMVIATASTEEKLAQARAFGADHTILSAGSGSAEDASERLLTKVREVTGKRGVDVVLEQTGAATWGTSIRAAARGGRIVTCGATSGFDAHTDLRHVFFRQLQILGSTMGPKGDLFTILGHVEAGRLRPVLDRMYPLEVASQAHQRLEQRSQFGKIVLRVS
ncbi:MAG TPA: zinc-binding dehydrogenase [Polyangia bacterium]|jgi:NADPH:quinone reductase-like Zn-dependent oxidoreductase|nr:zinc-binding dehydrogenase [Polyangia bacterium]